MRNCSECGAELGEHEVDLCSKCASNEEQADETADVIGDNAVDVAGSDAVVEADVEPGVDSAEVADEEPCVDSAEVADEEPGVDSAEVADEEPGVDSAEVADEEPGVDSAEVADEESDVDSADIAAEKSDEYAAMVMLSRKEKQKRLIFTLVAGVVIVGLVIALILVLLNSGDGTFNGSEEIVANGLPARNGDVVADSDRVTVCPTELLERLRNYDGDDFDSFFTELMFRYSEDPGLLTSPGGYLFMHGDMAEEFWNASVALEIGEISGLVETMHGFHIIYRIPIDPEAVLQPWQQQHSLRMLYSRNAFLETIGGWIDGLDYEFTPEFYALDFATMFVSSEESQENQDELSMADIDFDEIFATNEPDTPMIVAGNHVIMWDELFSAIFMNLASLYENFGHIPNLFEPLGDDTQPLYEVFQEVTIDEMISRLALNHNTDRLNMELFEEIYEFIDESTAQLIEELGGEEELLYLLWESLGISSIDLYKRIGASHLLPQSIFDELYGEGGALFPLDELFRLAEEDGLVMAKHILIRHESIPPGSP